MEYWVVFASPSVKSYVGAAGRMLIGAGCGNITRTLQKII